MLMDTDSSYWLAYDKMAAQTRSRGQRRRRKRDSRIVGNLATIEAELYIERAEQE